MALVFLDRRKNARILLSSPPDSEMQGDLHSETDFSKISYNILNLLFNMFTDNESIKIF